MISSFWGKTKLYCIEHEEPTLMDITIHKNNPVYECPICHKTMSTYDFEKMINHFQDILTDGYQNDELIFLKNQTWKTKRQLYKVLDDNENEFKVGVVINDKLK